MDDGKDHPVEDEKMEKTFDLNPEEDICSTEQNQSSMCIHECSNKASVADSKWKDTEQIFCAGGRVEMEAKNQTYKQTQIKYEENFKP